MQHEKQTTKSPGLRTRFHIEPCPYCHGTGQIAGRDKIGICIVCDGTGQIEQMEVEKDEDMP